MKKEPMNAADKALKHEINFLHNQISIISNIDVVKSNHKNVGYTTMLCTDGTCSVLLNQRELHIKKNDLLFLALTIRLKMLISLRTFRCVDFT